MLEQSTANIREQTEIDNNIQEVVYNTFKSGNLYFQNGMALGLYRIFGAATLVSTLSTMLNDEAVSVNGYVNNPIKMINIFSILLPVFVYFYDKTTV